MTAPPLTWLYVPADRPDRIEKALASRAHAVILDLEDAVAPAAKEAARAGIEEVLGSPLERRVHVRVNALGTPWAEDDLAAVASLAGVAGINLAKTDDPTQAADAVARANGKPVQCLLESARAVEEAYAIARVEGVAGIGLGEADLAGETGAAPEGLDWVRSRIVNASVAAGLGRPAQSVYAHVRDLDGLRASCLRGRALGFLGRTAIHPGQLETIEAAYLPTDAEAERARELVVDFAVQEEDGVGAYALDDGSFVDAALVRAAWTTVALAEAYGTSGK